MVLLAGLLAVCLAVLVAAVPSLLLLPGLLVSCSCLVRGGSAVGAWLAAAACGGVEKLPRATGAGVLQVAAAGRVVQKCWAVGAKK